MSIPVCPNHGNGWRKSLCRVPPAWIEEQIARFEYHPVLPCMSELRESFIIRLIKILNRRPQWILRHRIEILAVFDREQDNFLPPIQLCKERAHAPVVDMQIGKRRVLARNEDLVQILFNLRRPFARHKKVITPVSGTIRERTNVVCKRRKVARQVNVPKIRGRFVAMKDQVDQLSKITALIALFSTVAQRLRPGCLLKILRRPL